MASSTHEVIDLTLGSPSPSRAPKQKRRPRSSGGEGPTSSPVVSNGRTMKKKKLSGVEGQKAEGTSGRAVSFLTWNVWFGPLAMEERMRSIGASIEKHSPEVCALQEVTEYSHALLSSQRWWKRYHSYAAPNRHAYYELLLVKKDAGSDSEAGNMELGDARFSTCTLRSRMGRNLIFAETPALIVGTAHLESPCPDESGRFQLHSRERKAQMRHCLNVLTSRASKAKQPVLTVCMGDLNWDEKNDGSTFAGLEDDSWVDAWVELKGASDFGFTYDAKANGNLYGGMKKRLDRMLIRIDEMAKDAFVMEAIELVGTSPVVPELEYEKKVGKSMKTKKVYPSDHFGILLKLKCTM